MSLFSSEAFRNIQKLHIETKKLVEELFAGAYHSAFKGQGLEFEEVREYQPGDDIRNVDWNVTARMNHPFIKTFREERELTVLLLIDLSASTLFGSAHRSKKELIAEIGALLTFSAIQNHDKVGLILFTKEVELYLSPKKGTKHGLRVIRELLFFDPRHKGTNIKQALAFLGQVQKRRTVCFLISDFLEGDFSHEASLMAQKHDLVAIQVQDPYEEAFPSLGLLKVADLETGKKQWIDSSHLLFQASYREKGIGRQEYLGNLFRRLGIDWLLLKDTQSYTEALRQFFARRRRRH